MGDFCRFRRDFALVGSLALRVLGGDMASLKRMRNNRRHGFHPFLVVLAFVVNVMTVALPIWQVGGLPVRALVSLSVLVFCLFSYDDAFVRSVSVHKYWLLLFVLFALLGIVVSALNGGDGVVIVRQVAEIHLQGAVNLVLAAVLVRICGPDTMMRTFVLAVIFTALVAFFQFYDFSFAWQIRESLGHLQGEVFGADSFLGEKRPVGLSYSPIALATQLCLGFACFGIYRESRTLAPGVRRSLDNQTLLASALFVLAAAASGNRSPILGMLLFLFFYVARQKRAMFWVIGLPVAAAALIVLGPLLLDSLQQSDLRIAQTDDKSSSGRAALFYYGFLLFVNHPLGYGLGFDPTLYWGDYWHLVQGMPNAGAIQVFPLHNYILSMLNFYGVGILLLAPLLWIVFRSYRWTALYFIPYVAHIMFHNAGPFWDDPLIWSVIAVAAGYRQVASSVATRSSVLHRERS